MADDNRQPRMWTLDGAVPVIAAGAVAALMAFFFAVCLLGRLGILALAYTGLGALLMGGWAWLQWRSSRRRSRPD
jgi:hypothetical protein